MELNRLAGFSNKKPAAITAGYISQMVPKAGLEPVQSQDFRNH